MLVMKAKINLRQVKMLSLTMNIVLILSSNIILPLQETNYKLASTIQILCTHNHL